MPNYSQDIRLYLRARPILRRHLKDKIINCSSLAKLLALELYQNKKAHVAIRAALLRESKKEDYFDKIEENALNVLKRSTIEVRTGLCVVISKAPLKVPVLAVSTSKSGIMSVVDQENIANIRHYERLIKNVDMITICSGKELESTPGVVSLILNTLAQEGINVVEVISCHYDTILVLSASDTERTFQLLRTYISKPKRRVEK
ncbi:MAG: hypothetical protein QXW70_01155 [Candidatus Anstonellales archaeon]